MNRLPMNRLPRNRGLRDNVKVWCLTGVVLMVGLTATACASLNDEAFEDPPAETFYDNEACRGIEPVGAQLSCLEDYKRTGDSPRR